MEENPSIPVIMTFAGNDPSGGAGIVADIETIGSMGCHASPVITALTVQDTENIKRIDVVEPESVVEQARAVLEDMPVACFKIGMIGSAENAVAIHSVLSDYSHVPVVLDPILRAGGGTAMADEDLIDAMVELLFPMVTVLTPNSQEARLLSHEADTLDACAHEILDMGYQYVLITGTHESTPEVTNTLYSNMRQLESFKWERLPGSYHGSGCTLSSAVAGLLAHGIDPFTAAHEAQQYTWEALKAGNRLGMGQLLPSRFFWARDEEGQDGESGE